jgi:hypothetical protein
VDNRSLVLFLSGLAAAGAAVCIAVSCSDQPKVKCTTQRGTYTAAYALQGGADGGCVIPGEVLGVETYNPANADRTNADLTKALMAVKGTTMSDAIDNHPDPDPTATHLPYSLGPFTTPEPGGDNFCNVPTLNVAEQDLPGRPEMPEAGPDGSTVPAIDPQTVKYEWSNVRLFVTASALGTQMVGDLTYTVDSCTATYRVTALFPSIGCAFDSSSVFDGGPTIADPRMCGATSDLTHTVDVPGFGPAPNPLATGSGINPDFATHCDPNLLLCVLDREPK